MAKPRYYTVQISVKYDDQSTQRVRQMVTDTQAKALGRRNAIRWYFEDALEMLERSRKLQGDE